jgi:diguanylate cyclase (GGDEF)-like protein/PAS domain S-box-containing protein
MSADPYRTDMARLPLRAAAFVALVCVAILGVSGWREWTARDIVLKTAEVKLSNLARSLTQHAEDSLDLMDTSILGAVGRLEADGAGPEMLSKLEKVLVARKASLKRIYGIVISDENGNWVASSGGGGSSVLDRDFFHHHMESPAHDVFIGQPIRSRSTGDWITTVSRRYNRSDGSFAGIVMASIGAEYFSNFYRQFDIGAHSAIALMNADGIVLARSPDNGAYVGRDTSSGPLFQEPMLQSRHGVHFFTSPLDGMQRVSVYQRSDRFPLVVLATMQQDEVLASWRDAAITRMLFVIGLVMLIAVIGLFLVRQLLQGQRLAAALASKEANFRVLAEGSSDMVTRIGLDERVNYASPSSVRIVGWLPDQLVGMSALAGVNALDLPRIEQTIAALKRGDAEEARITYRTRHREKSEIWVESTVRVTRELGGAIDGVVAISRDVTEQKDIEGKLAALATEDGLTGLANRRRFDEQLQEEWNRAARDGTYLSLLMIDLDRFKTFNDKYGHPAGDECLRSVARILATQAQRTSDLAARYGGEEFVILLPNTDAAGCTRIGERIRRAIRKAGMPHALNLPSRVVTASLGGAVCQPAAQRSADEASLIEAADRALYAAKNAGRNRLVMSGHAATLLLVASIA